MTEPYPTLTELRRLFNARVSGIGGAQRVPSVIRLGGDFYDRWAAEMDEWRDSLPAHLRFVTPVPMFKGAVVERVGDGESVEFA